MNSTIIDFGDIDMVDMEPPLSLITFVQVLVSFSARESRAMRTLLNCGPEVCVCCGVRDSGGRVFLTRPGHVMHASKRGCSSFFWNAYLGSVKVEGLAVAFCLYSA